MFLFIGFAARLLKVCRVQTEVYKSVTYFVIFPFYCGRVLLPAFDNRILDYKRTRNIGGFFRPE